MKIESFYQEKAFKEIQKEKEEKTKKEAAEKAETERLQRLRLQEEGKEAIKNLERLLNEDKPAEEIIKELPETEQEK